MNDNVLPEPLKFDWDKGNIGKNLKKHGVTNEEAEEVFFDRKSFLSEDIKHSKVERRYQIVGKIKEDTLLNLIFTLRDSKVRIISARLANRKERKFYETKNKKTE